MKWSGTTIIKEVWIGIDRTPPQVLAPQSSRPPDYNGWFNHPVDFAFGGSDATSGVASCSSLTYAGPEGAGVPVGGTCQDVAGNVGAGSFPLNYDATPPPAPLVTARPGNRRVVLGWLPPSVSGTPDRAPDYNGWFNHPVSFTFVGQDGTSGIASCTTSTYGGPEGAGVPVGGTCQDVAGNVGAGSFQLNYDATPPSPPLVSARPGNRRVVLGWLPPAEAEASEVVRFAPGSPPANVFFGQAAGYTDQGLRNETRYRYSVAVLDRAGNRAQSQVSVVPTASKLLSPARGARVRTPPLLTWKPVRRASYYNVQLHRKGKVLSAWPSKTQLQLRQTWRFRGKRFRLTPGLYRWYVWPGFGRLAARRYGRALGSSTFRVIR